MRKLDFLSKSPQTFIFHKSSNKTRFGGFLTIIYILFILIMAIVYFYDYYKNDKYIISYNQYRTPNNFMDYEKDADPRYDPTLKFSFDVTNNQGKNLSDNLILYDFFTDELVERNKLIEKKVSETLIFVLYNCTDMICNIRDEDSNVNLTDGLPLFYFSFNFSYYDFNFEDDDEPIKLSENTKRVRVGFNPKISQVIEYYWQVAKVTEEPGILDRLIGKKKESFGGSFTHSSFSTFPETVFNASDYGSNSTEIYKILYVFRCQNVHDNYIEYRRKKISVLFNVIASICSIALTLFNGLRLGFSTLYSINFDNYKIIDRILATRDISMEKTTKKSEDNKSSLLTELKEIGLDNENENEKIEKFIEDKKVEENKESILPKYHFFDFIFNLFSCCCKNNKTQKCISTCNEIREKYYSIENILYNQLMMENLLKDYKWNNPDLKFIKNIQLIDKLNYIINDNQT